MNLTMTKTKSNTTSTTKPKPSFGSLILITSILIGLFLSFFPPYTIFSLVFYPDIEILPFRPHPVPDLSAITRSLDNHLILLHLGEDVHGPESIAFNSNGDLYFSTKNGGIRFIKSPLANGFVDLQVQPGLKGVKLESYPAINTGGRPLGLDFDADDNLVVVDPVKGLLKANKVTGEISLLTTSVNGSTLNFMNDVTVNRQDGTIYFTNSISYAPVFGNKGEWVTEGPSKYACMSMESVGKLISYNPITRQTKVLLDNIAYANGVSLDENAESVYIAETCKYRVLRYWLVGPKAGRTDVVINNLPGFPDGLEVGPNNRLFVSLFSMRSPFLDMIHQYPAVKRTFLSIPYLYTIFDKLNAAVLIADSNTGEFMELLKSSTNKISSTYFKDNMLYIGSK
ncbi:hypothetical protein PPL_01785 [Heterostelium album PN500]|uniref:Strictosidine synthase conserved region domain-containing protein n=1 Tax=Heterostelium pallidum (strain ATCC 26659 / Pp 5 / PN500) TaxID=670386 RepID=D3B0G8_HETP5|nr:hypothetical protein PPL_01785 [Heterostelium album PN500]EFA84792.1 hypothetical protein PPL_01785 [Heterostelium album PN500]|eukprot:XP_020436903.1 hypothetical protein PPL_01785 [Heterostelium album PN500]